MPQIQPAQGVARDRTVAQLHAALAGLDVRARTIAENVANVETPNYLAKKVSFEDSLSAARAAGDPTQFQVSTETSLSPTRLNGNNVNLDMEVVAQAETNLQQQLVIRALNAKYSAIRTALSGQ